MLNIGERLVNEIAETSILGKGCPVISYAINNWIVHVFSSVRNDVGRRMREITWYYCHGAVNGEKEKK